MRVKKTVRCQKQQAQQFGLLVSSDALQEFNDPPGERGSHLNKFMPSEFDRH